MIVNGSGSLESNSISIRWSETPPDKQEIIQYIIQRFGDRFDDIDYTVGYNGESHGTVHVSTKWIYR